LEKIKIMKKIKIYLRHSYYSKNTELDNRIRPEWFDKKGIFENLINITNWDLCDLKIIYDSHFGDNSLEFFGDSYEIIKINSGTEADSFIKLLDIIRNDNLPEDTIVYILEDDYLHRNGWETAMIDALDSISDYVSLYDHADKYTDYPDLTSKVMLTKTCHWRTVPSTCNTYACKASTLYSDFEIHRKYSIEHYNGISQDHSKFVNLVSSGRILITPIPGYSTHCNHLQSPTIEWGNYINRSI
jgi:hypothetical protein